MDSSTAAQERLTATAHTEVPDAAACFDTHRAPGERCTLQQSCGSGRTRHCHAVNVSQAPLYPRVGKGMSKGRRCCSGALQSLKPASLLSPGGGGGTECGVEVAFLVDSSESAKDHHAQETRFAGDVAERLQGARLASGRGVTSRAALLQYSSHVIVERTFAQWRGARDFKARVVPIVYIGHGTYATYAITNLTRLYLEESPAGSIKVAVLLYDGVSHPRNPDLFSAVADAKNQGVRFFTVGITPQAYEAANTATLRLVASAPATRYVHNLQDRGIVDTLVKEIALRCRGSVVVTEYGRSVGNRNILKHFTAGGNSYHEAVESTSEDDTQLAEDGCPVAKSQCACQKGERGSSGPADRMRVKLDLADFLVARAPRAKGENAEHLESKANE
ncbi:hypothetical protein CRUP_030862 [Coryphaenoides rupestris]|nr:hypothetical protein CRUP_030862 [Coryphaenoides rupestris]